MGQREEPQHATSSTDELTPDAAGNLARSVAAQRVEELQRWIDKAREATEKASLYELEADLQIVSVLAETTAQQLLRALEASGLIRASAGRQFARDELSELRETYTEPPGS